MYSRTSLQSCQPYYRYTYGIYILKLQKKQHHIYTSSTIYIYIYIYVHIYTHLKPRCPSVLFRNKSPFWSVHTRPSKKLRRIYPRHSTNHGTRWQPGGITGGSKIALKIHWENAAWTTIFLLLLKCVFIFGSCFVIP